VADDDDTVARSVMAGLGALLVAALVIGGLVSLIAVGTLSVLGLAGGESGPSEEPSLFVPPLSQTPAEVPSASPTAAAAPATSAAPSPDSSPTAEPTKEKPRITLTASPATVASYQQINLTGTYPGGNGSVLQVQRKQAGTDWIDFPSSATVEGGRFRTYVESGRTGRNFFRVVDESTGLASKPATVVIR
jgi:hypothetical protein